MSKPKVVRRDLLGGWLVLFGGVMAPCMSWESAIAYALHINKTFAELAGLTGR